MHIEDIAYEVDGIEMIGHLAYDDGRSGARPSVLLSHEGSGIDVHVKAKAERLAELGYCAFALDYQGGGVQQTLEQARETLTPMMADLSITRRRGLAGLDVLVAQAACDPGRVAAIGFCWGGAMSLEIARSGADIGAVVGFHPSMPTSPDSKHIKGAVLMCVGTEDPFLPQGDRLAFEQDMKDAGVPDWTIEVFGGVGHSFTNPTVGDLGIPGLAFDASANQRSWQSMLRLFGETIDA
jgi:dienelactone hydrolase